MDILLICKASAIDFEYTIEIFSDKKKINRKARLHSSIIKGDISWPMSKSKFNTGFKLRICG